MRYCGKIQYSGTGCRWQYNMAHARCVLNNLRLQAHTQNMQYLLFFHLSNGCTKAPRCYVIRTLPVKLISKTWIPQSRLLADYELIVGFINKHQQTTTYKNKCPYFLLAFIATATTDVAGPSGRVVQAVGLRPLACWDCGFDSHRGDGCLYVVSVVCCQVEVSVTS